MARKRKPKAPVVRVSTQHPALRVTETIAKNLPLPTARRPRRSRQPQRNNLSAGALAYRRLLEDPYYAPAYKLGFGTFAPTMRRVGWGRQSPSLASTDTAFAIMFSPCASGLTMRFFTAAAGGTMLSVAALTTHTNSNATQLAASFQTARIIAAQMRVIIRYAGTALRGKLYGVHLPDETINNIMGLTFTQLISLQTARECYSDAAGSMGGAVSYRPMDPSDFNFMQHNVTGPTLAEPSQHLLIIGTDWPATNFGVSSDWIGHYEGLSGVDLGGEEDDNGGLGSINIEEAGTAAQGATQPIIPSISLMESLDFGLSHAFSRSAFNGVGSSRGAASRALTSFMDDTAAVVSEPQIMHTYPSRGPTSVPGGSYVRL